MVANRNVHLFGMRGAEFENECVNGVGEWLKVMSVVPKLWLALVLPSDVFR